MPKAQKRRRSAVGGHKSGRPATAPRTMEQTKTTPMNRSTKVAIANRPFVSPRVIGPQSLLWPGMVALGCWGMAISFFVFSSDPNHMLFGAMAALMALLWSFSVAMRVRKLMLIRRNT